MKRSGEYGDYKGADIRLAEVADVIIEKDGAGSSGAGD